MIRFSAFLVAVAVGLLVAGVVTSKLTLVYVAIGVSGVALLALGAGTLINRKELFGPPASTEPKPAASATSTQLKVSMCSGKAKAIRRRGLSVR